MKNVAFIKQAVRESDAEKIVVVTYHLPTFAAIEDRHGVRVLNPNEKDEKAPIFYCFGIHSVE